MLLSKKLFPCILTQQDGDSWRRKRDEKRCVPKPVMPPDLILDGLDKEKQKRQAARTAVCLSPYSKRDLNPHSHYWPRDFKSLAQFHHSSILIFCYCAIKQTLISPYLYKKYCNKMSGLTHSLTPLKIPRNSTIN